MAQIGTAYVDVQGDFSTLNSQVTAAVAPLTSRFGKLGKAAAVGLAGIGVAAVGAGKALYDIGEQFDDAYDSIRVQTGATGKDLEGLKDDFRNVVSSVPTDFESASKAIGGLSQRLDLTGKPLRTLSKQMLELSRITETDVETNIASVTRAFGDWEVKTGDQSEQLDRFFRASQASGASVSDLADKVVQFGAPLRQVGFSLDEATAMFASFEKAGVNTQTMMPGLRQAMGQFFEEGIDPKKGLMKAFADLESGAMSSTEAIDLFGTRAGGDMIEAVKQGRFELDKMTKGIVKGDDTIRKAGKSTMDFSEQWQLFKNKAMVALEPIAAKVFDTLGKGMEWISRHPDTVKNLAIAIGVLTASFVTLKVGMAIWGVMSKFATALALARKAVLAMAAATRVAMLATGIGALVVVAGLIILNWNKVKKALGAVWNWMKGAAKDVGNFVTKVFQDVVNFIKKVPGWIKSALSTLWEIITWPFKKAAEWIGNKVGDIVGFVKELPGKIKNAVSNVGELLFAPFKWAGEKIKEMIDKIIGWVGDAIGGLKDLLDWIRDLGPYVAGAESFEDFIAKAQKRATENRQKGGTMTVPGSGFGDKVPVSVGGRVFGMAEPGEQLFFLNRNASKALSGLHAMNDAVPRFGGSGGGGSHGGGGGGNGGPSVLYADLYIGNEKIGELVRGEIRTNERKANHFSRVGVVPG